MSAVVIVVSVLIAVCAAAICFTLHRLNNACDDFVSTEHKATPMRTTPLTPKARQCAPEVIDPRRPRRGACGILGCPNFRPHSHAEDLIRRLKEPRQ